MNIALGILSIVIAYLLGSIPFAYIIGRRTGMDIRRVGDKNVGTFNVFRHGGMAAGIATLVADVGKGVLAILFNERTSLIVYSVILPCLAGLAHIWTTRHLSAEQQKEAVSFWVSRKASRRKGKSTVP